MRASLAVVALLLSACPPPDDNTDGGILGPTPIDGGPAVFVPIDAGPDAGPQDRPINTVTTIDAILPSPTGPVDGGYRRLIRGTGFTPTDLRIFFGDVEASNVLFLSPTNVSAEVPPCAAPGPVDVRVESTIGIAIREGGFFCFSPVTLASAAPTEGSSEGGTAVTIRGVGFTTDMMVLVGGREVVDLVVVDETTATFTTPPGAGRADVEAVDPYGRSVLEFAFTYEDPLALEAVEPNVVDDNGAVVELQGAGFDDDVAASIGGAAAARVNLISDARLRVQVPAGLVGLQDVAVTSGGESATLDDALVVRPTATGAFGLLAAVPSRADVDGGTSVTLVGEGLSTVTSVSVAGAAATDVVVVDDRTVTFTAPPGVVGPAQIVATRADASSAQLDAFSYFAPTVIDDVDPPRGTSAGGDDVTITGRGFTGAVEVRFGGIAATNVVVVSDTEITATTPAGSSGLVDVVVDGAQPARLRDGFAYEASLRIVAVRPARGGFNGNTFVTVTGAGFTNAPLTLLFEEKACEEVAVVTDNVATCRTPVGPPGSVDVTAQQGDVTDVGADFYTYFNPSSLITGVSGGPVDGAIYVTALDAFTGQPLPNIVAFVGTEGEPIEAGLTNDAGQATISGPEIVGPQTVTVAGNFFSSATFFDVNASEITVHLIYIGPPPPPQPPRPQPPRPPPATIRGRVFGFAKEFFDPAALDQSGCPPNGSAPAPCEIAFAEVNTTNTDEFGGRFPAGGDNIVFEEGGSYFIAAARPNSLALVALAGIFDINNQTIRFRQLGVRHGVFVPRTGALVDQDIELTIDLDAEIEMSLPDAPLRLDDREAGKRPSITRVIPFLQFAGEGAFVYTQAVEGKRNHTLFEMPDAPPNILTFVAGAYTTDGRNLITNAGTVTVTQHSTRVTGSGTSFTADGDGDGLPDVLGAYFVMRNPEDGTSFASVVEGVVDNFTIQLANRAPFSGAGAYHVGDAGPPSSEVVQDGPTQESFRGGIALSPVMAIPDLITPAENGVLIDRQLRWRQADGVQPRIHDMFIYDPFAFASVWEVFADGARTKIVLPRIPSQESIVAALSAADRARLPEEFIAPSDMVRGGLFWQHEAIFVPNLEFSNWSSLDLSARNRRAWTTDVHAFVHGDD